MSEKQFQTVRKDVLERDSHECQFCGVTDEQHRTEHGRGLDVHHIIPRRSDGSNSKENLITVCRSCHGTLEHTQSEALNRLDDRQREDCKSEDDEIALSLAQQRAETNLELYREIRSLLSSVLQTDVHTKLHIVHETEFTTSRLLYVGVDEEKAIERYREAENHATMETAKVRTGTIANELEKHDWRDIFNGDEISLITPEGLRDEFPESEIGPAVDEYIYTDEQ